MDHHQILTHVRPEFIKLGLNLGSLRPQKNWRPKTPKFGQFRTTSEFDRIENISEKKQGKKANCNLSRMRALNLVNFVRQTAKNRTGVSTELKLNST